jgi:hypothetical protein
VALRICALLSVIGSVIAWLTVDVRQKVTSVPPVDLLLPCHDPGREQKSA